MALEAVGSKKLSKFINLLREVEEIGFSRHRYQIIDKGRVGS